MADQPSICRPLGDTALIVELGDRIDEATHRRVQQVWRALETARLPGVVELVPGYATVTLFYEPTQCVAAGAQPGRIVDWLEAWVDQVIEARLDAKKIPPGRTVQIPVCFGGKLGPDLDAAAEHTKLPSDEVVRRFCAAEFLAYMLGFAPGFPYLGGLPAELAVPRRATPRARVAAGSVAIGGIQAGIYPIETPAGWNVIGRTPLRLYRLEDNPPTLLRVGDRIKFRALTRAEFDQWPAGGSPLAGGQSVASDVPAKKP